MRTGILGGLVALTCCATLWAGDRAQPLDVKVGLWEVTTISDASGQMPMSPDMLAKLSLEQRAKLEEAMKKRAEQGPKASVRKECMTQEKLDDGSAFGEQGTCVRTVISSSPTKLDMRAECVDEGVRKNFVVHMEATNPDRVVGSVQVLMDGGDRTMHMKETLSAKWIGSSCGDIEHPGTSKEHHDHNH